MKAPFSYRKKIPFYCHKTAAAYQKDLYEHYDSMVVRQTALHLADEWWGGYPMQPALDFARPHYPAAVQNAVEVGCGIGRWLAAVAQQYPTATCWGIDYSYQMLKRARECWLEGSTLLLDGANKGFETALHVQGKRLANVQLGVARASDLPFDNNSQDLVWSSFLLDRLPDPHKGLLEMSRILKPKGTLMLVTPLNFDQASNWQQYYPSAALRRLLEQMDMKVAAWQEDILIEEPLDVHGNAVLWKCLGVVAVKKT